MLREKTKEARDFLTARGLLLLSDSTLPSLVSLVTGKGVNGTWWGHPQGNLIFNVASELEDDAKIITAKLLLKKVTFIQKKLWPALATVGVEREAWQMAKLSPDAKRLLAAITKKGTLSGGGQPKAAKVALETRLLVHAQQVHTASGKHEMIYQTWEHFALERGVKMLATAAAARAKLAAAAAAATGQDPAGLLPWPNP